MPPLADVRAAKVECLVSKLGPERSLPHSMATRACEREASGGGGERKGSRDFVYVESTFAPSAGWEVGILGAVRNAPWPLMAL